MGGGEESTLSKPSKPNPSAQDTPAASQYPDWSGSVQAYYGGGATPPYFAPNAASPTPHPYMWGTQHAFMPPFGTPVPYSALYPPAGVFAHSNIVPASNVIPANIEIEGKAPNGTDRTLKKKLKGTTCGNAGSASGNEGATQSADSGSEGSSDASGDHENQGNPQASVPGNPAVSIPGTNMNIEMNLWNTTDGTEKMGLNLSGHSQAPMAGREGATTNRWMHDDRELKREKRKQSNRESARRSRLRKQAECEELQAKVEKLTNENQTLRNELQRISEKCQKIACENSSIKEEISKMNGSEAVSSDFEINNQPCG